MTGGEEGGVLDSLDSSSVWQRAVSELHVGTCLDNVCYSGMAQDPTDAQREGESPEYGR